VSEQELQQAILLDLGARADLCRLWRGNSGTARSWGSDRAIKLLPPGHPDLTGILANGRWLGLEVKTGTGRQSAPQKNFQAVIERFGGVYLVVRSVAEAVEQTQMIVRASR
jgi:hypothetical protein